MTCAQRLMRPIAFCFLAIASLQGMPAMAQDGAATTLAPISGGIGESERNAMLEQKSRYNLWVRTAAKRSGAYLSDVRIRILELPGKKSVLEHTMDGPWLFAPLAPGRYEIEASYRDNPDGPEQKLRQTTILRVGGRQEVIFYFDSTETTGPHNDNESTNGKH